MNWQSEDTPVVPFKAVETPEKSVMVEQTPPATNQHELVNLQNLINGIHAKSEKKSLPTELPVKLEDQYDPYSEPTRQYD